MDPRPPFLAELVEHGFLIPMGVDGLYGRSGAFEQIVESFNSLVTRYGGGDGAEVLRFPPGLGRKQFEESEYLKSFPHLAGTVHCFHGDDRAHHAMLADLESGADWTTGQKATDVVLTPAACYPLYPMTASRGPLPPDGRLSTSSPTASATSPRSTRRGCSSSACGNTCASARRSRSSPSARCGSSAVSG